MPTKSSRPVPVASRVNRFSYAIRNIVAEAKAVEARGTAVRYLNIGDPVAFGFSTPAHLVEAASRAMRDGHNGYLASAGILEAREAVAADYTARGVPTTPDRVLITAGTSEGIELTLSALAEDRKSTRLNSSHSQISYAVFCLKKKKKKNNNLLNTICRRK